jgi:hypothetical protein
MIGKMTVKNYDIFGPTRYNKNWALLRMDKFDVFGIESAIFRIVSELPESIYFGIEIWTGSADTNSDDDPIWNR